MKFLDIGNIVLTKGESSDVYEITSDTPLADYKGTLRISDKTGVKHEAELKHTKEVKNDDNIYKDNLTINYMAEKFDFKGNIYDETTPNEEDFRYKISITSIEKEELTEIATIKGKIVEPQVRDTLDDSSEREVLVSRAVETPIENAEVTISLTSDEKEITREGKAYSSSTGEFTIQIYLGSTTKVPAKNGLVFVIPSEASAKLDAGRYYCTVTITKEELDKSISFQKEVLQTKLDINEKN